MLNCLSLSIEKPVTIIFLEVSAILHDVFLTICTCTGTFSQFTGVPFRYDECVLDYSVGVGKDSVSQRAPTIPNNNVWASTFSNDRRMPWMARLDEPTGKFQICLEAYLTIGRWLLKFSIMLILISMIRPSLKEYDQCFR